MTKKEPAPKMSYSLICLYLYVNIFIIFILMTDNIQEKLLQLGAGLQSVTLNTQHYVQPQYVCYLITYTFFLSYKAIQPI